MHLPPWVPFTYRLTTGYSYRTIVDGETTYDTAQVSAMTNNYGGADHTLTYTYDANGNIISVSDGTNTTTYTYDSLNQLTAEYNEAEGKSWVYTYDTGGNILTKTEYPNATASGEGTTISYTYGDAQWGDLLTAYNGSPITYDGSGNPLSMNGWSFTWQGGRQLAGMTDGTTTLSFGYNDSGLRTSKTVGNTTHTYTYQGSTLIADVTATDAMYFHYDPNGSVIGFTYDNGTTTAEYYYVKNLQGDIIGILDASGALVASYTYDAWGNILTATDTALANRNPIRYRGYYYDVESALYYLQSRYYNPEVGRFINADSFASAGSGIAGFNMYAYCNNNPTCYSDFSGCWPEWIDRFVDSFKQVAYDMYYNATKWHFEDRIEANGTHPTYDDVLNNSNWRLLSKNESRYHIDNYGKDEMKYVHADGREAVFDGDTLQPVTDPQYMATYNYIPLKPLPSNPSPIDYVECGLSYVGHCLFDVIPYELFLRCNTREQFENKLISILD